LGDDGGCGCHSPESWADFYTDAAASAAAAARETIPSQYNTPRKTPM